MDFCLPQSVQKALDALTKAGYEAYLVGGCVRDALRGTTPHDYDIATNALPDETLAVFSDQRTITTGLRHGTVTVLLDKMPIEITTYRVDGTYADHRRPDTVTFTSSLGEDLARRDFTVNAMAYHPEYGIVDLYSGRRDLADGIIRAVGEPMARFSEDALRILRALRFSARFGFRIEKRTREAVFELADTLSLIAPERVREELYGILAAPDAERVLSEYKAVLAVVLPQGALTEAFGRLPPDDILLRLADFLLPSGVDGAGAALAALRADNKTILWVKNVLSVYKTEIAAERECVCRLLRRVGEQALRGGFALRSAHGIQDGAAVDLMENILADNFPYTLAMLTVRGEDLMSLGVPRGSRIGELLEHLYTAVIRGEVENTKKQLLEYGKRYI